MTYQEAKKIALSIDERMDTCHEDDNSYQFSCNNEETSCDDRIIVVLKKTGKVIGWIDYLIGYPADPYPLILDFETGNVVGRMKDEE